jgi:dephospho-CoA kinase
MARWSELRRRDPWRPRRPSPERVRRIGLTGGLASGKSTVSDILVELGAAVLDADDVVRQLYRGGGAGAAAAKDLFGDAVVGPDGRIDRMRIAALIFTRPEARHALEANIHPLVKKARDRFFAEAEKRGYPVAVVEASQLLEAGTEKEYDRVVLVVAPEEERVRRWGEKGGDPEDARRRISAQIRAEAAQERADDVLWNGGSPEELRRKVSELYRSWTT